MPLILLILQMTTDDADATDTTDDADVTTHLLYL